MARNARGTPTRGPSMATTDPPRPERLLLAAPRGYCAGVDRAVQTVERALELYGAPVYVRKEIVHNKHVVAQLRERGAIFVEELDDTIPEGATTVFSAHGVSPAVHADAKPRNSSRSTPPARSSPRSTWRRRSSPPRATRSSSSATPATRRSRGRWARRPSNRARRDRGGRRRARGRRPRAHRLHLPDHPVGRRDAHDHQPPAREVPAHHRAANGRHLLRHDQPPGRRQADGRRVRPRARDRLPELLQLASASSTSRATSAPRRT